MTFTGNTNSMDCPKVEKVKLATFLLQDSAKDWWILNAAIVCGEGLILWKEFKKAFKDKFYPSFYDMKGNNL